MVVLYIVIGIAVGAVVLYLLMDRRMDALRIAGGKADIELKMKTEQLAEKTSRVQHLEVENRDLHAKAESQGRERREQRPARQGRIAGPRAGAASSADDRGTAAQRGAIQEYGTATAGAERIQAQGVEHRDHVGHYSTAEGCDSQYAEGHQRKPEGVSCSFGIVPRADADDDAADTTAG